MGRVPQGGECSVFRVGGQRDLEIRPLRVELETGRGGSVICHGLEHLGQAGEVTFRKPQLLQQAPDVAVAGRYGRR